MSKSSLNSRMRGTNHTATMGSPQIWCVPFLPSDRSAAIYPALCAEFALIDLDRRLKRGWIACVDDYLKQFPALKAVPDVVRELIKTEYCYTLFHGHDPDPRGYADRFPTICDTSLLDELRTLRTDPDNDPEHPRYRIIRTHRRGGLGEVYEAYDRELKRRVALKEIQEVHADDPRSRSRFLDEARITSELEHPGIVPVYGLGKYTDGRPYYAMQFIRGESLKEAIDRFHADKTLLQDPRRRSLELRKLLRADSWTVCNAIGLGAHSRGVIHRDIKPGNIIVGKHGETLVVDWGLARESKSKGIGGSGDEPPNRPSSDESTGMGTIAFMSPEQLQAKPGAVAPANDVYSLGASLYNILAGQPPCAGIAPPLVLPIIREGRVPPLRKVRSDVPAALEAIYLRAMALQPGDRYSSAVALAADVEAWLADEPTSAYPDPLSARLARWGRRYRPVVTGAAATLVVSVAALVFGTVLIGRQCDRAEANAAEAQVRRTEANLAAAAATRERLRAEANFRSAREAQSAAEASEKRVREHLILSDLRLAAKHWEGGDIGAVRQLLALHQSDIGREARGQFVWDYLRRLGQSVDQQILGRHQTEVQLAAFTQDGMTLVRGRARRDGDHLGRDHAPKTLGYSLSGSR